MSAAIDTFTQSVAYSIIVIFVAVTGIVLSWYFLKKDTPQKPVQEQTQSPATVQRLAEKAVGIISSLNEISDKVEQLDVYAQQKVGSKRQRTREENQSKTSS